MLVNELILKRYSALAFSREPLDDETIKSLMEAARWAPSSSNRQPWLLLYAKASQNDLFDSILSALHEGNRVWVRNASLLIVVFARMYDEETHAPNPYAWHDCGLALQNLLIQATFLNLAAHPMGGFDRDRLIANLRTPELYSPVTVTAVGYPGNLAVLPDYLQKRASNPRSRKPLESIVKNDFF